MVQITMNLNRFFILRNKVFEYIEKHMSDVRHDGIFSIIFPDYITDKNNAPDSYVIKLECSVLGPRRYSAWFGKDIGEVVERAEKDIYKWINDE